MPSIAGPRGVVALALLVLVGCSPAPRQAAEQAAGAPAARATPKRLTAVIMGDPPHFAGRFNPSIGSVPGLDAIEEMVNAGMANFDGQSALRAQLAETVPSLENGLWKLFPDGRME